MGQLYSLTLYISSAHHSEGESFESNNSVTVPVNRTGGDWGGGGGGCDAGIVGAAALALLTVAAVRRKRG
jgi:Synergist-CTERM protein sorting domain-containing protein